MKRHLLGSAAAAALCGLATVSPAHAIVLSGFLAECRSVTATSCTEQTTSGYARRPTRFGDITESVNLSTIAAANAQSVSDGFATGITDPPTGHAICDAPTGGNLIAVAPTTSADTVPSIDDHGDIAPCPSRFWSLPDLPPMG